MLYIPLHHVIVWLSWCYILSILDTSICSCVTSVTISFIAFLSFCVKQSFLLAKLLFSCLELLLFDSNIWTKFLSVLNSSSFTFKLSLVSFNCLSDSFSAFSTFTNCTFSVLICFTLWLYLLSLFAAFSLLLTCLLLLFVLLLLLYYMEISDMLFFNSFISVCNLVTFILLLSLNSSASFINSAIWFSFCLFSAFTVFNCSLNSSLSILRLSISISGWVGLAYGCQLHDKKSHENAQEVYKVWQSIFRDINWTQMDNYYLCMMWGYNLLDMSKIVHSFLKTINFWEIDILVGTKQCG